MVDRFLKHYEIKEDSSGARVIRNIGSDLGEDIPISSIFDDSNYQTREISNEKAPDVLPLTRSNIRLRGKMERTTDGSDGDVIRTDDG